MNVAAFVFPSRNEKCLALGGDRGDHVHRQPLAGAGHHRGAPHRCPGGAGVVVGPHARLVGEEDGRTCGGGLGVDGRVLGSDGPRVFRTAAWWLLCCLLPVQVLVVDLEWGLVAES